MVIKFSRPHQINFFSFIMAQPSVSDIFDALIKDKVFCDKIENSIANILSDFKIDQSDIPEIIFIITEILINRPDINVKKEDVGTLIKRIFEYIVIKKNLATKEQVASFDKILDSSIKLFMAQPNIGKAMENVANKLNSCLNCCC